MSGRYLFAPIARSERPTLRRVTRSLARLVVENWFYALFLLLLWAFPYLVAALTGTDVMPRRPTGDSAFWQSEMARALTLACLAMSYNVLFGFAGIISFGHALFFGAGGYVTFILLGQYDGRLRVAGVVAAAVVVLALALIGRLSLRALLVAALIGVVLTLLLLPGGDSISFAQAAGVALAVSIGLSLLSGAVTLRLRGIYFTMFTLALAEMFWVLAKSGTFRNITGAEDGLGFGQLLPDALNPTPTFEGNRLQMYRVTVVFFALVFLAIRRYLNSPVGRVMLAIRDNEVRARTIGYNTFVYKVLTIVFAGAIATASGLLFLLWSTDKRVHPEILSLKYTVNPLLYTLIGGLGTLTGPVIATLGLSLGEKYLRNETFALDTQLLGVLRIWQIAALLVALAAWALLRGQRVALVNRLRDRLADPPARGAPRDRRLRLGVHATTFALLVVIALVIGAQAAADAELAVRVYKLSDLWDLFLGILFVVVVMLLPLGIVGTWNRFWAVRRVRRATRQTAQK